MNNLDLIEKAKKYLETVKDQLTEDICVGSDYPESAVEYYIYPYIINAFYAGCAYGLMDTIDETQNHLDVLINKIETYQNMINEQNSNNKE